MTSLSKTNRHSANGARALWISTNGRGSTARRDSSGILRDACNISRYLLARSWVVGKGIVDVACGSGHGSAFLARDPSCRVTGVDLSANAIEGAKADWSRSNLVFRVGDALDLDMPPGSAHTVVSFETIEHIADHVRFLDQVTLLLRPGGRLVLSTPDRAYYSPGAQRGESHNPFHLSEMTHSELLELLSSRFRVIPVYDQTLAFPGEATSGARRTRLVKQVIKQVIKQVTNPILGRGRLPKLCSLCCVATRFPDPMAVGAMHMSSLCATS